LTISLLFPHKTESNSLTIIVLFFTGGTDILVCELKHIIYEILLNNPLKRKFQSETDPPMAKNSPQRDGGRTVTPGLTPRLPKNEHKIVV